MQAQRNKDQGADGKTEAFVLIEFVFDNEKPDVRPKEHVQIRINGNPFPRPDGKRIVNPSC